MDQPTYVQGIETRKRIVAFVKAFIIENKYSPSIAEIGAGIGLRSKGAVGRQLNILKENGEINFVQDHPRTITLPDLKVVSVDG